MMDEIGKKEYRAVWFCYFEMLKLIQGKNKREFRDEMKCVFDKMTDVGLNTAIIHMRPFCDALYRSDLFPWSYFASGKEGVSPGYDPLSVITAAADCYNISIEAWVNPFRIRGGQRFDGRMEMADDNYAKRWAGTDNVLTHNGGLNITLNPARKETCDLIVAGVAELARNYPMHAIHIDDYFYPYLAAEESQRYDIKSYTEYQQADGRLSLADWRRNNVAETVRDMYAAIKREDPDMVFGISPAPSIGHNFNALYADIGGFISQIGYADYILPQLYFGFNDESTGRYTDFLEQWLALPRHPSVQLYVGLGAYLFGARPEWTNSCDIMMRQVLEARKHAGYAGFSIFSYSSLFDAEGHVAFFKPKAAGHADCSKQIARERNNLKSMLLKL